MKNPLSSHRSGEQVAMPSLARIPELLAPAGDLEALEAVLDSGANSVYVGGKLFGMRQHASWLNFSEEDLAQAIEMTHSRGRSIYVTLNSLLTDTEIDLAGDFLDFLEQEQPDALIVQDWGMVRRCLDRKTLPPLHASTMMNVHDAETARFLKGLGFTRIVASRDITLEQAVRLQTESGIEFEVFLHGDMCIAHSGQCLTSGILAGESSNRGRCLKPCRWEYDLIDLESGDVVPNRHEGNYLLARKDLSLLEDLDRVAGSGIAALKIEGRARKPEFLRYVVSSYRKALDDYAISAEDFCGQRQDLEEWKSRRIRNQSTCYTFGNPGAETIDFSGQREPRFFSLAIEHAEIDPQDARSLSQEGVVLSRPSLAIHCAGLREARAGAEEGANQVRIPAHLVEDRNQMEAFGLLVAEFHRECDFGIVFDRVVTSPQWNSLDRILAEAKELGVTHAVGNTPALATSIRKAGLRFVGDYGLNVLNSEAADFLCAQGAGAVTVSLEATLSQVVEIARQFGGNLECIVHGSLTGMLLEHCVLNAMMAEGQEPGSCQDLCIDRSFGIRDPMGQIHEIRTDPDCRNHVQLPRELCGLSLIPELCRAGVAALRIESRFSSPRSIRPAVSCYRKAIQAVVEDRQVDWSEDDDFNRLVRHSPRGFSLCSFDQQSPDIVVAGQELPTNLWLSRSASAGCSGGPVSCDLEFPQGWKV